MEGDSIKILFAGDFVPPQLSSSVYSENLQAILKEKDFSIVNLEAPFTVRGKAIKKTGKHFKINPELIDVVKEGFFDAVALANNHIRDYGNEGVRDTLHICHKNCIDTIGAGVNLSEAKKSLRIKVKDKRIAFLNYCEREFNIATNDNAGANAYDTISAYYDIQKEKQKNDYIFVIYHGGLEYQYYPTIEMVTKFRFMIDAGADCIIAHHSHRYSGVITYKNKPIFFGLGNFLAPTVSRVTEQWQTGIISVLELKNDLIDFKIIPVRMSLDCNTVDILSPPDKVNVIKHINEITEVIKNDSLIKDYWQKYIKSKEDKVIHILKSNNRLGYKLRKRLSQFFYSGICEYKLLNLLNMVQCDSHRDQLVQILNNLMRGKDN